MYAFNNADEKKVGMIFCIITHVKHIHNSNNNFYYGYAPYVREMNIWLKYSDQIVVVAPLVSEKINPIHENYNHQNISFRKVEEFDITSFIQAIRTLVKIPRILYTVFIAMKQSDHIHLRCPGNMGLVGVLVQILFPKKKKTAKYAGNWDPKSKQPITYKFQRWILSNAFLTKNMQVLVYGEWPNQTKNIKPFFTATYDSAEIRDSKFEIRELRKEMVIRFLFVGALVKGKQPIYAMQLVHQLKKLGYQVLLELYGEGEERENIEQFIALNGLSSTIFLKGNQPKEIVKQKFKESHFLILPSISEGWPKVVAEAMFWGCVPIATPVSCVSNMLDNGNRGILLEMNIQNDSEKLLNIIESKKEYQIKAQQAVNWSRKYTIDYFESEIKKLLIDE